MNEVPHRPDCDFCGKAGDAPELFFVGSNVAICEECLAAGSEQLRKYGGAEEAQPRAASSKCLAEEPDPQAVASAGAHAARPSEMPWVLSMFIGIFILPPLFVLYYQLIYAIFLVPLYYITSLVFAFEFSFWEYARWSVSLGWFWSCLALINAFFWEFIIGLPPAKEHRHASLSQLQDIKKSSLYIVCLVMGVTYCAPVVLWLNQDIVVSHSLEVGSAFQVALYMLGDSATFSMLSTYGVGTPVAVQFNGTFWGLTYVYITNLVFAIATITVVGESVRAIFLPSRARFAEVIGDS